MASHSAVVTTASATKICQQCQTPLPFAFFENLGPALNTQLSRYCVPCHAADMVKRNVLTRPPTGAKALDAFVLHLSKLELRLGQRAARGYDMDEAARQCRKSIFAKRFLARLEELLPGIRLDTANLLNVPTPVVASLDKLKDLDEKFKPPDCYKIWRQEEIEDYQPEDSPGPTPDQYVEDKRSGTSKRRAAVEAEELMKDQPDPPEADSDGNPFPKTFETYLRRKKLKKQKLAAADQRTPAPDRGFETAPSNIRQHQRQVVNSRELMDGDEEEKDEEEEDDEDVDVATTPARFGQREAPVSQVSKHQQLLQQIAALHLGPAAQVATAMEKFGADDREAVVAKLRKLRDGMPAFRAQVAACVRIDEMARLVDGKNTEFVQLARQHQQASRAHEGAGVPLSSA